MTTDERQRSDAETVGFSYFVGYSAEVSGRWQCWRRAGYVYPFTHDLREARERAARRAMEGYPGEVHAHYRGGMLVSTRVERVSTTGRVYCERVYCAD